MIDIFFNFPKE